MASRINDKARRVSRLAGHVAIAMGEPPERVELARRAEHDRRRADGARSEHQGRSLAAFQLPGVHAAAGDVAPPRAHAASSFAVSTSVG